MEGNGAQPTSVVLTITLDQLTGSVQVSGPIGNRFVCYGMLEMAKEAIAAQAKPDVKPSHLTLLPPGSRLA